MPHQPGRSPEQHRERAEAESDAERDHMREFEILKWQADEASKAHYRQVERDEAQRKWHEDFAAKQESQRIAAKKADDESHRKWQEEQDKKRQDAENARHRSTRRQEVLMWLVGGAVIGLAALIGYFGDRHFAELDKQREKDTKTVSTAKTE